MPVQTTSRTAYGEVRPTIGTRQHTVLRVIENNFGGITNKELAKFLGWEINTVTPRVNELVKMGLVYEREKRYCRVTGRLAIVWDVVSDKLF